MTQTTMNRLQCWRCKKPIDKHEAIRNSTELGASCDQCTPQIKEALRV